MRKNNANNNRLPRSKGTDMATYYTPKDCAKKVKRIVLPPINRQIIEEFITILGMREKFEQHDVPIPNKVVLFGPPGTGKTLTAFYIATRLELPLILVRLDAIARTRETNDEVKEMARAVNTLLQCLDEFECDSMLIAATNLEDS